MMWLWKDPYEIWTNSGVIWHTPVIQENGDLPVENVQQVDYQSIDDGWQAREQPGEDCLVLVVER